MALAQLRQITTQDEELRRVQANLAAFSVDIQTGPFFNGNVIQADLIGGTPQAIKHGLQRQPQYWILSDLNANAVVWRISWDENFITLQSNSNCSIKAWVS